jgi:hypothetical protein
VNVNSTQIKQQALVNLLRQGLPQVPYLERYWLRRLVVELVEKARLV